mgnify:CR=1 FL=1|jgi:hypothetical protein
MESFRTFSFHQRISIQLIHNAFNSFLKPYFNSFTTHSTQLLPIYGVPNPKQSQTYLTSSPRSTYPRRNYPKQPQTFDLTSSSPR